MTEPEFVVRPTGVSLSYRVAVAIVMALGSVAASLIVGAAWQAANAERLSARFERVEEAVERAGLIADDVDDLRTRLDVHQAQLIVLTRATDAGWVAWP